jgi:hypothetical protein
MRAAKRLGVALLLIAGTVGLPALLDPAEAEAYTCDSACNQIRRACNHVAKAARKVAQAICDDERDACRAECEATAANCEAVCAEASAACLEACATDPDPVTCQAECAAAAPVCPEDCEICCQGVRVSCRADANEAREAARLVCAASRDTCDQTCVDPINAECVRDCVSAQHDCAGDAKRNSASCDRACPGSTGQRACKRECRKLLNQALGLCSAQERVCVAGCIGVAP